MAMLALIQSLKAFSGLACIPFLYEKFFGNSVIVLPDDIPRPSELGFKDLGFYVSCFCAVLKVCDLILSFNGQDRTQSLHVKVLQQFHVPLYNVQVLNSKSSLVRIAVV